MKKNIKIAIEKEWTKEEIRERLANDDLMVLKSLLELYKHQLPDERNYMVSTVENGKGFNRIDTPFLTQKAKEAMMYKGLSKKDIAIIRPTLMKYSGQLAKIANSKGDKQLEWKL